MTKFIVKTVEVVFIFILAIILLAMSVSIAEQLLGGVVAFVAGVILLACVIGGLMFFREKIKNIWFWLKLKLSGLSVSQMMIILFLFSAALKIFFVFLFDNNTDLHPDMEMYRSFAKQFAENGSIVENSVYALKHGYTLIYGIVLSPFALVFGDNPKVFLVVLSILHSVAMLLMFDILYKRVGKEKSFFILMLYCILPFGMFQTQLLIHENGLLFFHILAFWLFLKAFENKNKLWIRVLCFVLSFVILSVGKSINASGGVMMVSFAIYSIAKFFREGKFTKKIFGTICVCLAFVICYIGSSTITECIVNGSVENKEYLETHSKRLPYGWGLFVGFNYDSHGSYDKEDAEVYHKYEQIEDKEEAFQYQKDLLKDRFSEYNAIKAISHLFNKIKMLYGTQLLPFAYGLGNSNSDFVLRFGGGIINKAFITINSVSFLFLYSVIFISKIKTFKKKDYKAVQPHIHCQMVIIGVTLALLLFEVTPKYASHLHILFFFILAMSAGGYMKNKKELQGISSDDFECKLKENTSDLSDSDFSSVEEKSEDLLAESNCTVET